MTKGKKQAKTSSNNPIDRKQVIGYNTDMEEKKFLSVKYEELFKLFFADERNEEELVGFLKSVLDLPEDDYHKIEIADPHLLREFAGDKLAIIDVKLRTASGKIVHIEIQLKVVPEYLAKRIVLYGSKLVAEQIGSGDDYDSIKKVISIIITGERFIKDSPEYHHCFILYDVKAKVAFPDAVEYHTLELSKLPQKADGTELYDWAKFIAAESEEEMDEIAQRNPEVSKAVVKYREFTADERVRAIHEQHEKARRDQAAKEKHAQQKGEKDKALEIARKAIEMGLPTGNIVELTGLTFEEVLSQKSP